MLANCRIHGQTKVCTTSLDGNECAESVDSHQSSQTGGYFRAELDSEVEETILVQVWSTSELPS